MERYHGKLAHLKPTLVRCRHKLYIKLDCTRNVGHKKETYGENEGGDDHRDDGRDGSTYETSREEGFEGIRRG